MLAYYLEMEPALFKSAIEDQFERIRQEKEKREKAADEAQTSTAEDSVDLALSGLNTRVQEMRDSERRATVRRFMTCTTTFLHTSSSFLCFTITQSQFGR